MSKQSELNSYISQLLGRLRLRTWILGAAVLTFTALATTILLVLVLNHYAFPATGVRGRRLGLLFALAVVASIWYSLCRYFVSRPHAPCVRQRLLILSSSNGSPLFTNNNRAAAILFSSYLPPTPSPILTDLAFLHSTRKPSADDGRRRIWDASPL